VAGRPAASGDRPGALEAQVKVGRQPELRVIAEQRLRLAVAVPGVSPGAALPAVVERRLAFELDVDEPVQATDGSQQHPVGGVIGRRPVVLVRPPGLVPPRPDQQHVADHGPAAGRGPRRLEHHRARQVPSSGRHGDVGRPQPE
jgi:hypothetical protein